MKRLLLFIFFGLFSTLHACALCQLYTPKVGVYARFEGGGDNISKVHIVWRFSEIFSRELALRYGSGDTLNKEELEFIQGLLLEYLTPRDFLSSLKCAHENEDARDLEIMPEKAHTFLQNSHVHFSYTLPLNLAFSPTDTLSLSLEDSEGFFDFVMMGVDFVWSKPLGWSENLFNNVAFISNISAQNMENQARKKKRTDSEMEDIWSTLNPAKNPSNVLNSHAPLQGTQDSSRQESTQNTKDSPKHLDSSKKPEELAFSLDLAQILSAFQMRLKELLEGARGDMWDIEMLSLLGFSLFYGALHAAGPGHGKMLVSSYFFGTRQNRTKAAFIALAIGIVHTFSAFLMTLGIYYFFEIFFKAFLDNFIFYATKFSALIIISIALYLLYHKLPFLRAQKDGAHAHTCTCAACKSDSKEDAKSDVMVVLGASIVPCPGTVTIFIFSIALGEYFLGFLSALCMSLGMSGVIFIAASLGLGLKNSVAKYASKFVVVGEILGLCVMFLLGVLLLAY